MAKGLGKRRRLTEVGSALAIPSNAFSDINTMLGRRIGELSQAQKKALASALKREYHNGIDLNYLKTVIFPELFSADIPQPLTNLSYCKFTDKQEAILNTGGTTGSPGTGAGLIVWYPRVTEGPSLFYYKADNSTSKLPEDTTGIPFSGSSGNTLDPAKWRLGFAKSYADNFSSGVLVAASLSIQYIGQVDSESGIMVGGHLYGQGINNFQLEDIEHAQYVTTAKPSEGLRFVYLPVDGPDYDFAPVTYGNSHNAGAHPTGNEQLFNLNLVTGGYKNLQGDNAAFNAQDTAAKAILYSNNTNFVAIYWKGLPTGQDWLRVDMTRRYNGIPRLQNRDIMEVTRPKKNYDARKSFDVLRQLCTNSPVGGHTLKELDQSQEQLLAAIPEIGGMNIASFQGADTLQELAASLYTTNAEQKGLIGDTTGAGMKRLYHTLF